MVHESQNFKKNFSLLQNGIGAVKPNQKSPTNSSTSPSNLLMQSKANENNFTPSMRQNLAKRQFSLDHEQDQINGSRKNYSLNDFFPSFHSSILNTTKSSSTSSYPNSAVDSQVKPHVGPIQRPMSNSTNNSSCINSTNDTNNVLENYTSWLSSSFKNSNNLTANLNIPTSVISNNEIYHTVKEFPCAGQSDELLSEISLNPDSLNVLGKSSDSSYNQFKLFGTESNSSNAAATTNFNESSIWNAYTKENQAWNSVLINDINSLVPTQSFLNSSSSGNQIKNLWSNSSEFVEAPSNSTKNSQKQQKAKKLETKSSKK